MKQKKIKKYPTGRDTNGAIPCDDQWCVTVWPQMAIGVWFLFINGNRGKDAAVVAAAVMTAAAAATTACRTRRGSSAANRRFTHMSADVASVWRTGGGGRTSHGGTRPCVRVVYRFTVFDVTRGHTAR